MLAAGPAEPPAKHYLRRGPSPSPAPAAAGKPLLNHRPPIYFSPPLIAMVAVAFAALLLITSSRHLLPPFRRLWSRWRRRRFHSTTSFSSAGGRDLESLPPPYGDREADGGEFYVLSPYGLDESVIATIPLTVYGGAAAGKLRDCAVCLLEFDDGESVRTLPACSHAFHVDCIDVWLRSHANCPLCRAGIFRPESPFIPVMAARIRPSLDGILDAIILERSNAAAAGESEIEEASPARINIESEDRFNSGGGGGGGRDFLLKRSYSFGFERSVNFQSESVAAAAAATGSPWRYRRRSFLWSKRQYSPLGSVGKAPRVFSFRYYSRGMKSPFFRRRGSAGSGSMLFPLSERFAVGSVSGGGGSSSRRSKSMMMSPMFGRAGAAAGFSSSRLRCGDLEALLSPERFSRR